MDESSYLAWVRGVRQMGDNELLAQLTGKHRAGSRRDADALTAGRPDTIGPVPTISAFYGILIRMYFSDHPPPHFHVRYGEHKARCAIATGELMDGELPTRAARLVREWASLHRVELEENWRRCEQRLPLSPVEPLP